MPYVPKDPFPKAAGNPIRADDWNKLVEETQRLDAAKLDKTGGTISGRLTLQQTLGVEGTTALGVANIGGALMVTGAATLRASTAANTLSVAGTSSFGGVATFGDVRVGSGGGTPFDNFEVAGTCRILTGSNPIRFSSFEVQTIGPVDRKGAEIRNDTDTEKTLLIMGNRSSNTNVRLVSVRDKLEVHGQSCATSFCNLSDGRLKTDVQVVGDALDRISRLRGVSFRWRNDPQKSSVGVQPLPARNAIGVVAQEVADVLPELVSTMGVQEHLTVDYPGLTAVLVEAVKQLKADNEQLRRRVDALEAAGSAVSAGAA